MLDLSVSVHTAWPVMQGPYFKQLEVNMYVVMLLVPSMTVSSPFSYTESYTEIF